MAKLDLGQAEFLFHSDALADAVLQVFRFTGREEISQPFEFSIELASDDPDLDLLAPIGQPACFTLRGRLADGSRYNRYVHGVVERFVQLSAGIRQSRYQATLVPTIKPLHYTRNARIFQKQSAPDVTKKVLQDGKVPADWVNAMLHGSYGPRDYCVQYQESDLNFVQRLWEEEGIAYFFEHTKDKDTISLGDGSHAFDALAQYSDVRLRDQPHMYEEGLHEFRAENSLRAGAALLRDFKFKQPALDLEASAEGDKFADYKMYYFPGEYVEAGVGKQLATVRLQEQQCQRSRYIGTGNVRAMLPGYKFTLAGHRRSDCNQEYLIVTVTHQGSQPLALGEEASGVPKSAYENTLECIPAQVTYRPQRRAAAPSIPGVQTALVVGPAGEEIHCDSHGRIKVQFHWDREGKKDDASSCWIRVSQPWGGVGQGGMFIPRVGQEVVVQFLEGDPDRPLIIGRVYNGENVVPYGLPDAKNISTIRSSSTPGGAGFNEIRLDDSAGKEQVFFHAQKDQQEVIGNDHDIHVKNDQTESVDGKRQTTVTKDDALTVHANQTLAVDGHRTHTVHRNENIHIGGSQSFQVDQSQSSTISKTYSLKVGLAAAENIGLAKSLSIGAGYMINVGAALMMSVGGGMMHNIGAAFIESVGLVKKTTVGKKWQLTVGAAKAAFRSSGKIALHGGSSKIEMQPGKITLDSGGGATIELHGDKITLCAAKVQINGSADVQISAPKIEITGKTHTKVMAAQIELSADSEAKIHAPKIEITGTAQAKVTAPKVEIAGSATTDVTGGVTTVKGTPVKINC